MYSEGVGLHPPKPFPVHLTKPEVNESRQWALRKAEKYRNRKDTWGKGIIHQHGAPDLIGALGEKAFQLWGERSGIRMPLPNWMLIEGGGDGGIDAVVSGVSVDVKTRQFTTRNNHVVCAWVDKTLARLAADVYAFFRLTGPHGLEVQTVEFVGWVFRQDFDDSIPMEKSPCGDWWNFVVHDDRLRAMHDLATHFRNAGR